MIVASVHSVHDDGDDDDTEDDAGRWGHQDLLTQIIVSIIVTGMGAGAPQYITTLIRAVAASDHWLAASRQPIR